MAYTNNFIKAMPYIFLHEGNKFTNIANDAGGPTLYGVSLRFLQSIHEDINHDGVVDVLDIKSLTQDEAKDIYFHNFWRIAYDSFQERVAIKVFDVAVNAGSQRAHILLQRALNALGSKITVDGMLGKQTISEIAKYTDNQILQQYCAAQKAFYQSLVTSNPSQQKFLNGWINRSQWIPA